METNAKKLKDICEAEKRISEFSPQINPPMKKPLYNEEFIKKFLQEKTMLQSQDCNKKNLVEGVTVEKRPSTPKKPPAYTSLKKIQTQSTLQGNTTVSHATTVASLTSAGGDIMPPLVSRNSLQPQRGQVNNSMLEMGGTMKKSLMPPRVPSTAESAQQSAFLNVMGRSQQIFNTINAASPMGYAQGKVSIGKNEHSASKPPQRLSAIGLPPT